MSWYVSRLLLDREKIKENIYSVDRNYSTILYDPDMSYFSSDNVPNAPYLILDLDSDTYSDLLTVEIKLEELIRKGLISKEEIRVLDYVLSHEPLYLLENNVDMSRVTMSKKFKEICDKIAFYLGDHFTDEGYIEYIKEKYKLNEEQTKILIEIIERKRITQ